jgi:hypothetical protein
VRRQAGEQVDQVRFDVDAGLPGSSPRA